MKTIFSEGVSSLLAEETALNEKTPVKIFRKKFTSFHPVRMHYHSSLEVNLHSGLKGVIETGCGSRDLSGSGAILIPPSVLHSYRIHPSDGEMIIAHFSISSLSHIINSAEVKKQLKAMSRGGRVVQADPGTVREILLPLLKEEEASGYCVAGMLLSLTDLILEHSMKTSPCQTVSGDSLLRQIISYTEEHYGSRISAGSVSRDFGLSKAHFCRFFKRGTGMTYGDYLNDVRCEYAAGLLSGTGKSITEIALETGYYDASHFIGFFRRKYGCTPGRYRSSS